MWGGWGGLPLLEAAYDEPDDDRDVVALVVGGQQHRVLVPAGRRSSLDHATDWSSARRLVSCEDRLHPRPPEICTTTHVGSFAASNLTAEEWSGRTTLHCHSLRNGAMLLCTLGSSEGAGHDAAWQLASAYDCTGACYRVLPSLLNKRSLTKSHASSTRQAACSLQLTKATEGH